jgi:anti-sigma regulatory factor (Ser/Thr protein kinase)
VEDEQAIQPVPTARALAMESQGSPDCSAVPAQVIVTQVFPGRHDQVAHARAFVRAALGPVPVLDEAVLLVSELCTNALLHTASGHDGTFKVIVYPCPLSARIEVRDGGANQAPSVSQPANTYAEDGRGLGLVELLADRWGHSSDHTGRSVFFDLHWKQPH